ncbi:MAG: hypothetical protein JWR50_1986, partial [Mucilaginibacter sp.]|nr:hypothetical protein [Mucilaginibacter sp.]
MKKSEFHLWIILCFLFCFGRNVIAQGQENVRIQCDKYVYKVGDTIWWKGYVLTGNHFLKYNTNLTAELFTYTGKMVDHALFPVIQGQTIGQFNVPDTLASGIYWLRCYTKYQASADPGNLLMIPIAVYHWQDKNVPFLKRKSGQKLPLRLEFVELNTDTLSSDVDGYNSWNISIKDSTLCHISCSITDADETSEMDVFGSENNEFRKPNPQLERDTDFLHWTGKATRLNGKKLAKNSDLMVLLVKDSAIVMNRILRIDTAGHFSLNHLFFFGKGNILFQLNKTGLDNKDVQLVLDTSASPAFKMPDYWVKNDTLLRQEKLNKQLQSDKINGKGIRLKEVQIKGWKSPRKELDHQYASGEFTEPAMYAFDLRTEKNYDLGAYLRSHLPGFTGGYSSTDTPKYLNDP